MVIASLGPVIGDTEFRVVERPADRVFDVVRCSPKEPVELMAECPQSYNRETARARALRIAGVLRDDDAVSGGMQNHRVAAYRRLIIGGKGPGLPGLAAAPLRKT